jgi:hypothetical protein
VRIGGELAGKLPYVAPVAFAADLIPEGAVAAIAPTQPVPTDELITAWVVAEGPLGDGAGVVGVAGDAWSAGTRSMRAGRAIADRLGHGIGLGPDHIGAQMPAVGLQRERHAPGNADQILTLERVMAVPLGIERTLSGDAATITCLLRAESSGAAPVGAPI